MEKVTIVQYREVQYTRTTITRDDSSKIDTADKVEIGKGDQGEPQVIPGKTPAVKPESAAVEAQKPGSGKVEAGLKDGYPVTKTDDAKKGKKSILDAFKRDFSTIDIVPDEEAYKNISTEEGAKMLGFFTQKMESRGFPWALYKPGEGIFSKRKKIGEYEALMRLSQGKPVVLQLRRILGLGISPPKFKGKNITGQEAEGDLSFKTGGVERDFGEGIRVDNFAEMKFLYHLYNPDAKIDETRAGDKTKAVRNMSFFVSKSLGSQYPWKLYKPDTNIIGKVLNGLKTSFSGALTGTFVGAMASLLAGGLVSVATGAMIGAGIGIAKAIYNSRQGKEINAFEALYRLSKNEEVTLQENKKHEFGLSLPFPVNLTLGSLSFYLKHGEGSKISNFEELELFNKMQDQKEGEKKDEKTEKK